MEWSLPSEKAEKARRAIFKVYNSETVSLHTLQSLVGRLNDIALMCPFLSAFRRNISALLANTVDDSVITVPSSAKDDLLVWWAAIDDCESGLPIPSEPSCPNIFIRNLLFTLPPHTQKMRTLTTPQALDVLDLTRTASSSFHAATYGINTASKQNVLATQADRSTSWV